MTLVELLVTAKRHGFVLTHGDGGTLRISGPRTAGHVARALPARKVDVLSLVDFYAGLVDVLDWHDAKRLAPAGARCVLCRKPCMLLDPYDGQPSHKTCFEFTIRNTRPEREST